MNPGQGSERQTWRGYVTEDPSQMLIALQYVEEFVAQSDVYPLGDG